MTVHVLHMPVERDDDVLELMLPSYRGMNEERRAAAAMKLLKAGRYTLVAEAADAGLDDAWRATQNIEMGWHEDHPEWLKPVEGAASGCRSSMVGDVFVVDGRCHLCESQGFRDIGALPLGIEEMPKAEAPARRAPR